MSSYVVWAFVYYNDQMITSECGSTSFVYDDTRSICFHQDMTLKALMHVIQCKITPHLHAKEVCDIYYQFTTLMEILNIRRGNLKTIRTYIQCFLYSQKILTSCVLNCAPKSNHNPNVVFGMLWKNCLTKQ